MYRLVRGLARVGRIAAEVPELRIDAARRICVQPQFRTLSFTAPFIKLGRVTTPANLSWVRNASSPGQPEPYIAPDALPSGSALKKYGKDLTEAARKGKLDPVIGRDDEIRRTLQVLARRTKNNPVLIGEPGVGM